MAPKDKKLQPILLIGDALAIFAVIIIGLRFHEGGDMLAGRLIVNFLPFLLAWFLAASSLGFLRSTRSAQWNGLWQVPLAAAFTAPLGAVLRGIVLNRPVLPVFVLVMYVALLVGLVIWRAVYVGLVAPRLKSK